MRLNHAKLKQLRTEKGISQEDLAADTGIPGGTYRDMEQGLTKQPRAENMATLARYFGVQVGELWLEDETKAVPAKAGRGRPRKPLTSLPFCGWVNAGKAVTHSESKKTERITFADILGDGDRLIFQVSGRSMVSRGIFDHDYIIVAPESDRSKVPDGRVVVVRIDGGLILKELERTKDGRVILHSRSDDPRYRNVEPTEDEPGELVGYCTGRLEPVKPVYRMRRIKPPGKRPK